jgi:hypothetical protein
VHFLRKKDQALNFVVAFADAIGQPYLRVEAQDARTTISVSAITTAKNLFFI